MLGRVVDYLSLSDVPVELGWVEIGERGSGTGFAVALDKISKVVTEDRGFLAQEIFALGVFSLFSLGDMVKVNADPKLFMNAHLASSIPISPSTWAKGP